MNAKVDKIIAENLYLCMSVSNFDLPWIFNAYFAYDYNNTFYWYSSKKSCHSVMIKNNPNVSICIYNSTAVGDDVDAVYATGVAQEVVDLKEISTALILYGNKMIDTGFMNNGRNYKSFVSGVKDFKGISPLRLYKMKVDKFWTLAESKLYKGKFVDSKSEV